MAGPGVARGGDKGQLADPRHPRPAEDPPEVWVASSGDDLVITVVGAIDDSTAAIVEVTATTALETSDRVVVDLHRTGAATARSLRTIAAVAAAAQDRVGQLVLRGACRTTRRFLSLRRLDVAIAFER